MHAAAAECLAMHRLLSPSVLAWRLKRGLVPTLKEEPAVGEETSSLSTSIDCSLFQSVAGGH